MLALIWDTVLFASGLGAILLDLVLIMIMFEPGFPGSSVAFFVCIAIIAMLGGFGITLLSVGLHSIFAMPLLTS